MKKAKVLEKVLASYHIRSMLQSLQNVP